MTPETSRRIAGVTNDAQRVARWLCEKTGGGLPPENCKLIVSCPDPPTPLQDQINEIFIQIFEQIPSGRQGRRLYFYFSGGTANPKSVDDAVLCLTKWSQFGRHDSMSHGEYKTEAHATWATSASSCSGLTAVASADTARLAEGPDLERRALRNVPARYDISSRLLRSTWRLHGR